MLARERRSGSIGSPAKADPSMSYANGLIGVLEAYRGVPIRGLESGSTGVMDLWHPLWSFCKASLSCRRELESLCV